MSRCDIYLCGVGGQGIGLLSTVLAHAAVEAGVEVHGADTHGLAQRGGTVSSHLRLGPGVHTPLVPAGGADIVIGLERLEALRGLVSMLRPGGTVLYYDAVQQPIHVRLGATPYPGPELFEAAAAERAATVHRVLLPALPDPRMQNVALLGRLAALALVPGLDAALLERTLLQVVPARVREANLTVFHTAAR